MVYLLSCLADDRAVLNIVAALAICLIAGSPLGELLRRSRRSQGPARGLWLAATALVAALVVWTTHVVAISGLTVTRDAAPGLREADHGLLGLLVFAGALALLVGALLALHGARRFDAQEKAHASVLSTALQNMSNGLLVLDGDGRLDLYNERFREMFALGANALRIGMAHEDLVDILADAAGWHEAKRRWCREQLLDRLRTNTLRPTDQILPNGGIAEIDSHSLADGGIVLTFDDVTDARAAQNELSRLALHDALTGLANRRALHRSMEEAIAGGQAATLVVLGLDRFRFVNETYGHVVGDQLLVQVAERLKAVSGAAAILGRLGGDEMAVVAPGDAASAADLAGDIIEAVARPYQIGDIATAIGCSVGIAPILASDTPEELMQRADIALSEAKRQGRGRFAAYRTGLQEAAALRHRLTADLRAALSRGEFHLAYQPIVSLDTDEVLGFEALLRWDHPELGAVSPAVFVPLAEESGEILAIGEWVLGEACRTAAGWTDGRHVAVNVSTVQFRSPLLHAHVVSALARSGLPANRLEIELTETALVEDGAQIAHILGDLRRLGIKVAMDDFGTGYSSLAHISTFPVDRIKIDRSFVASAERDRHSLAVIKAVLLMGRDLDIATLAEGVETPSQLQLLRDLGCGSVQGYLLGRPMRLDAPAPPAGIAERALARSA